MSDRLPEVISREDALKLIAACDSSPRGIMRRTGIFMLWRIGLRISELVNLAEKDIDWRDGLVAIKHGKGNRERVVPLDPETLAEMKKWDAIRPKKTWFFCHKTGKRFTSRMWQKALAKLSEQTGVYLTDGETKRPVHPHVLRHNFATEMLEEGFNIREVQQCLGHKNLQTTMIYTQVRLPELRKKFQARRINKEADSCTSSQA